MRSLMTIAASCFAFFLACVASAEDLGLLAPIDGGVADALPPAEAPSVLPAPAPAVAPAPSVDPKRFEELNDRATALALQNDSLKRELDELKKAVALLDGRLRLLEVDSRYKLAAFGLGLSLGMGSGSGAAFKAQANLKGFSGFYYAGMGGGIAWSMVIHIDRFRVSPLGFGFMVYQDSGNAFTSRWLRRSMDIALPLTVDVRVWKGITVGMGVAWYVPNPVDVAIAAKEAGTVSVDIVGKPGYIKDASDKAFSDSGEVVSRAFGDALKSPRIELVVQWSL